MTELVVLNSERHRTVEMHTELFRAALRTFDVSEPTIFERSIGFVRDGVCLGIGHMKSNEPEFLVLNVAEELIVSLFGPEFAEEHGGWFELKPFTDDGAVAFFIDSSLRLQNTLRRPVKIRVIKVT